MQTINNRVNSLALQHAIMTNEDQYVNFVREWRKLHEVIVVLIMENKTRRQPRYFHFANCHQSLAQHYGQLANELYTMRADAKFRLRMGEIERTYAKDILFESDRQLDKELV